MTHPLHPIAAHFPIALLFASIFADLLSAWKPFRAWRSAGFAMLVLGTVGAAAAVITGNVDAAIQPQSPAGEGVLGNHSFFAHLATLIFAAMTGLRVYKRARGGEEQATRPGVALYLGLAALGAGLIIATGLTGGELVYKFGAAVTAMR